MTQVLERPTTTAADREAPETLDRGYVLLLRATYPLYRLGIRSEVAGVLIVAALFVAVVAAAAAGIGYVIF